MKKHWITSITDNGHPERAFFQKFESFGLGQTNWAEILGCILVISSQTIGTILALWVPCSWESVAGSFSYKKRWFLGLKHTTPKYSQNKILAVKNLEKSLRTSVFSDLWYYLHTKSPGSPRKATKIFRAKIYTIFLLLLWENRCRHKFILSLSDL